VGFVRVSQRGIAVEILDCCEFFEMIESEPGVIERFPEFYVEDVTCAGGCADFDSWAFVNLENELLERAGDSEWWRFVNENGSDMSEKETE